MTPINLQDMANAQMVWMPKATLLKERPAAPIETFARFQAGFLSSEDFHCFLSIFIDFYDFYRFSQILVDFHVFRGMGAKGYLRNDLLPL